MNFGISSLFGLDVGIDIGTVSTLISRKGDGVILRECTAVALDNDNRILTVGDDALSMVGRTPGDVHIVYPLQDGVVADYRLCEAMLRHFIVKSLGRSATRLGVRAVLCAPGCITNVEKRALEEAARGAGARTAFMLDEPVAAALGAGLPVHEPFGSLVVDIGGGTTDAAVLALGGVVVQRSVHAGGTHLDAAIISHLKQTYGVSIGPRTAETIKLCVGSAQPGSIRGMEVRGRDINTGLPRTLAISAMEIYRAMQPQINAILGCVRDVLSVTPPELAGDIYDRGIWLTGGGALLHGIADYFASVTGISTYIAENPLDCVVEGTRLAIENIAYFRSRAG